MKPLLKALREIAKISEEFGALAQKEKSTVLVWTQKEYYHVKQEAYQHALTKICEAVRETRDGMEDEMPDFTIPDAEPEEIKILEGEKASYEALIDKLPTEEELNEVMK